MCKKLMIERSSLPVPRARHQFTGKRPKPGPQAASQKSQGSLAFQKRRRPYHGSCGGCSMPAMRQQRERSTRLRASTLRKAFDAGFPRHPHRDATMTPRRVYQAQASLKKCATRRRGSSSPGSSRQWTRPSFTFTKRPAPTLTASARASSSRPRALCGNIGRDYAKLINLVARIQHPGVGVDGK